MTMNIHPHDSVSMMKDRNDGSCSNGSLLLNGQVSFNKRTHASTLYKAMAAKQRLEELERLNTGNMVPATNATNLGHCNKRMRVGSPSGQDAPQQVSSFYNHQQFMQHGNQTQEQQN